MAKAASPIRLQNDLMQAAESTARRFHRSTAEQIEYWAELGRSVSSRLDPDVLLSIMAGLSRLNVEPVVSTPVAPEAVFGELNEHRRSGSLTERVTTSPLRYQASVGQPGWLEQIDEEGAVSIGQFENGEFVVREKSRD
jgi:hypothetical protein